MSSLTTIAAIATAPGIAGIGIIRISGPESLTSLEKLFLGPALSSLKPNSITYGKLINEKKEVIDEVLVSVFRQPHSYTGEDIVEINCHGSRFILSEVLQLLMRSGVQLAKPGEFTMRAYLNGKMDLSQAEAVADLIQSETSLQHRLAMNQMKGGIKDQIAELRGSLIDFASLLELELDFSEEDVEFANRQKLFDLVQSIVEKIHHLINSFSLGNAIKYGISTVIAGRPNAGKSTLLNSLLQENRAIVSEIAGTTRDTIEESINIEGVIFRLIDTAGIRNTEDIIESLGVERSLDSIQRSSIMLYVADIIQLNSDQLKDDLESLVQPNQKVVVIANKMDLQPEFDLSQYLSEYCGLENILGCSVNDLSKIKIIKTKLLDIALEHQSTDDVSVVVNARHRAALENADRELNNVIKGLKSNLETDLVAQSLRRSIYELGSVTGEVSSEDLLGNIFSRFCIGK